MEYTQNYHMPKWVKEDRIMMEDFNQMSDDIESGLTAAVGAAGDARDTAAQAKQIAQQAAAKPYVVGSYVGTGASMTINLGFRPAFLIVSGMTSATGSGNDEFLAVTGGSVITSRVELTATGFVTKPLQSGDYFPNLCDAGRTYNYIAFR